MIRLYSPRDLRVEEAPEPKLGRGEVLIRVERAGICGTDKALYKGTYRPRKLPLILGHEVTGTVVEAGGGSEEARALIGSRVVTEINLNCGNCWYCRNGLPTHCPYRETIGISIDGGFAEYVKSRVDIVHVVDDLTPTQAAFIEPLAAVVEMLELAPPPRSSNIAVIGVGTIGLLAIRLISETCEPRLLVAVTEAESPKKGIAREMGAHHTFSANELSDEIKTLTPEGLGFDYVVEASGTIQGFREAVEIVRPRGIIALKSTHGIPATIDLTKLVVDEVTVAGSRCGPFEKAIDIMRRRLVPVERLVTSEYPLERGPEAMEKSLDKGEVKIHLIP
ncbi:MAG: alcohol dehydrogenase catalytic domain-containing protein [Nitrososphaerota archaeon]